MGNACAVCGIAVIGTDVMYTADGRIVCPLCFGKIDPLGVSTGGGWRGFAIAGAIAGGLPFAFRFSTMSSSTIDGEVTSFVYRDWIAVAGGVAAIVLALLTLWAARKEALRRGLAIAAGAGVLVLGGFQIARGFGVFEMPAPTTSFSITPSSIPDRPRPVGDPAHPETCPDQDSCWDLGRKLEEAKDFDKAIVAYARACERSATGGCFNAGLLITKRDKPDWEKSFAQFQHGCDLGDLGCCNETALDYKLGRGTPKDLEKARRMFDQSCNKNFALGCTNLADFYAKAIGIPEDHARAFELFAKGCDLKDVDSVSACDRAGGYLYDGIGMKVDQKRAASYFVKGCALAAAYCYNLGVLTERGEGIAKDLTKARELYDRSCKAGKPDACNNFAHFLDEGIGGPKDHAAAKALFKNACDDGSELACKNLKTTK